MQAQELFNSIIKLLKYHQQIGISGYRRDSILDGFLKSKPPNPDAEQQLPRKTLVLRTEKKDIEKKVTKTAPAIDRLSIAEIAEDVRSCTACELARDRQFPVIGIGGSEKVRLLVVGDWCRVENAGGPDRKQVMGRDEDQMLFRMMQAIKLDESQFFISNVIKCALQPEKQPKADHVTTCFSYLQRQIATLNPEVICSMGLIGTRALLKTSTPLSRLRGRFHPYETEQGAKIPVLPTYHPNYLLQNPEMKKATWDDLQFLARYMGLLK